MAVLSSQTRGELKQIEGRPHQCTSKLLCMAVLSSKTNGELRHTKGFSNRSTTNPSCMAVFPSQTRGKLKQTKCPSYQCTGMSIVHGRASIPTEREAQTDKRSSLTINGQVHGSWPCFHQRRMWNPNKRKVLLTNVRESPSYMAVLLITNEREAQRDKRSSTLMYGQVHRA